MLGILGPQRTNHLFWHSRASLDLIRNAYIEQGYDATLIRHLFRKYDEALDEHREQITHLGEMFITTHGEEPPDDFFNHLAGFDTQYLHTPSEEALLAHITRSFDIVHRARIDQHARVVVIRAKAM